MAEKIKMNGVWPKIVLFGDSQVQRSLEPQNGLWGALLANRLQRLCDVVTRGFSGYTSRSCLSVLPHVFFPENIAGIKAFVIFLGTNDSSGKEDANVMHVPVKEFSANLENMINYLVNIGLSKDSIILLTPGPYHDGKFMKWCEEMGRTFPKKDNNFIAEYVDECLNLAKQFDIDVVNIYQEIMKIEDWPEYLLDGLHFSHAGSTLIDNLLWPLIKKRVDTSEMLFPYWQDINPLRPEDAKCSSNILEHK